MIFLVTQNIIRILLAVGVASCLHNNPHTALRTMKCNCDPEKKLKFYPERSGALIDYRRVQIDSRHLIREGAGGRAARQASDCHCHKVTVDLRILLKGGAFFAAFILFLLSLRPLSKAV